jgi:shikimate kinase
MQPAQLVSRLHNRQKRPLIANMNDEQLLAFIEMKLAERNPFYTKAQHTVNAFDLEVGDLVKTLRQE